MASTPFIRTESSQTIVFSNSYGSLRISQNGQTLELTLEGGANLVVPVAFASYRDADGQTICSTAAHFEPASNYAGVLNLSFTPHSDIELKVHCQAKETHFFFSLDNDLPNGFQALSLVRVGVTAAEAYGEIGTVLPGSDASISSFALVPETKIEIRNNQVEMDSCGEPRLTILQATTFGKIRAAAVKVALAPWQAPTPSQFSRRFQVLAQEIELEYGLKHPTIASSWAKTHPDVKGSYLFVDITPDNASHIIDYACQGSFSHILCKAGAWSNASASHLINYERNEAMDPVDLPGLQALRCVADHVHAAPLRMDRDIHPSPWDEPKMLKLGLHTLTWRIAKGDPIYGNHPCRAWAADGTPVDENNKYIPDINCNLIDEIAQRFARIYNAIRADMVYLDGTNGGDPEWNGVSKVVAAFTQRLDGDLLAQSAVLSDFAWHSLARHTTGDFVAIGVEKYMEAVRDFLTGGLERTLLPVELGWIGFLAHINSRNVRSNNNVEDSFPATRLSEIEFQLNNSLYHDHPISLETTHEELIANGLTATILQKIGWYEQLRLAHAISRNWIDANMRTRRERLPSGQEARIVWQLEKRGPQFGFIKQRHIDLFASDHGEREWQISNPSHSQPLRMRITALPVTADFSNSENRDLLNLDTISGNWNVATPARVESLRSDPFTFEHQYINQWSIDKPADSPRIQISARNSSTNPGWLKIILDLPEALNLSEAKAIGVILDGDSKNEAVSIALIDHLDVRREFQTRIDFSGAQTKILLTPSTDELFDYDPGMALKWALRPCSFTQIQKIGIFIKNVPGRLGGVDGRVDLTIGPVKALRQSYPPMVNPTITVEGSPITLRASLEPRDLAVRLVSVITTVVPIEEPRATFVTKQFEPWQYLEINEGGYKVYDGNHHLLREENLAPAERLTLAEGNNTISLTSAATTPGSARNDAKVTLIIQEDWKVPDPPIGLEDRPRHSRIENTGPAAPFPDPGDPI